MLFDRNHTSLLNSANIFLWPIIIFLISFVVLIFVEGGPITNDELKYLALSIDTSQEPRILNRYFHVYLQKVFIYFFDDPFLSMQVFWSFLVSLTMALTFYSAILISNSKSLSIAFLSLLFLLIQPLIFRFVGVTYADYTVMFLLALSMAIYLSTDIKSLESKSKSIFFLSALLVLSVKSKETGFVNIIFIFGIIFSNFEKSTFLRLFRYILFGTFLGVLIMALFDGLLLDDYFFSWRFSNIEQLLSFNSGQRERVIGNWYSLITQTDLIIPFTLYLLSLPYMINEDEASHIKFLYLLPIFIILFLTIISGFGRLRIVPRYILPIIPVLSVLAANYFQIFNINKFKFSKKSFFLLTAITLISIIFAIILKDASNLINLNGWTPRLLLSNIFYPLLLSLILICFIFLKRESRIFKISFLVLFTIMVLPPLIALPNNLLYSGKLFNDRIQPLKDFGNYLKLNEKTIIILSADTQGYRGALIPFYFNAKISCSDPGDNLPILCANDENKKNYSSYFDENGTTGKDGGFDYAILTMNSYINNWKEKYPSNEYVVITNDDKKYMLICRSKMCKN